MRAAVIPIRTRQAVAACAALDLTYWCGHSTHSVWAVDDNQRFHTVRIDRKAGASSHSCYDSDCGEYRTASWVTPAGAAELFAMLGGDTVPDPQPVVEVSDDLADLVDVGDDLGSTGHCSFGRHQNCQHGPGNKFPNGIGLSDGSRYMCPCECHQDGGEQPKQTAAEKRATTARITKRKAARDEQAKEVAAAAAAKVVVRNPPSEPVAVTMIRNNPAAIPSLHVDYLRVALGHTPYDDEINAELQRREAS